MKAILTIFLLPLFTPVLLWGQLRIGLTAGYQTALFPKNPKAQWDENNYLSWKRNAIMGGLSVELAFKNSYFSILSGIQYSGKGRSLILSTPIGTSGSVVEIKGRQWVDYVEFPLLVQYDLARSKKIKFEIAAGGYVGFLKSLLEERKYVYNNGPSLSLKNTDIKAPTAGIPYQNRDAGLAASVSVSVGKVRASGNISSGLIDLYSIKNPLVQTRNRVYGVSIIYFFKKFRKHTKIKRSRDSDKDGIPDKIDDCPNIPGIPSMKGCPDTDGDSIPDLQDQCPFEKGGLKYNGCPIPDSDGDGINDETDKCPFSIGTPEYSGCPVPDSDRDGVFDTDDRCPDIAGLVRYEGCPMPDRDRDGVDDEFDRCPSLPGDSLNLGCPVIKKEIKTQAQSISKRIQFNYKSVSLTAEAKRALDIMVRILKTNKDLKLYVEGHSSIDGNPRNHQPMSEARALTVRNYLLSHGIAANRLKAIGFGSNWPLVKGNSPSALAQNRRVELRLSNFEQGF